MIESHFFHIKWNQIKVLSNEDGNKNLLALDLKSFIILIHIREERSRC